MCFPAPVFFCSNEMKTLKGKSSARWSSTLCVCGGVPHDFLLAFFFEQKQEPVGGLYPRNKKSANNSTKEIDARQIIPSLRLKLCKRIEIQVIVNSIAIKVM